MKNFIIKGLVVSSLATSALLANGAFVGIEAGIGKTTIKVEDQKAKEKSPIINLKGGYDFESFRVYGAYNYNFKASRSYSHSDGSGKVKWSDHKFMVGADYTPSLTQDFKLALGAYTGARILDYKEEGRDNGGSYKQSFVNTSPFVGVKFGGIYSLDSHNKIEFGTRYDYGKVKSKSIDNDKLKFYDLGLYLGYTYNF